MLDEASARRSDFSDGPKVVLGDGRAWTLPRPWLRLFPSRDGEGRIGVGGGLSFGPEFEDLIDELTDSDPDDHAARLAVQFRMAALLLQRNYDLTDRNLRRLLVVDAQDAECRERWAKLNQVLTGRSPKTFSRWLRCTLIANGVTQDLPWEDAIGVSEMLVALGRAVPPSRWIDDLDLRAQDAARESLFDLIVSSCHEIVMPSNDDPTESGDRLDRFLIAEPSSGPPRNVAGIDAFLADPPLPAEPTPPPPAPTTPGLVTPHDPPTVAEAPTIDPHRFPDETVKAADPPSPADFAPEAVDASTVLEAFGNANPELITPPSFEFPGEAQQSAAAVSNLAVGNRQSGGGDALSALAASPLDDRLLADPSALLSAAPPSNPAGVQPASDRFAPWSSNAPETYRAADLSGVGPMGRDAARGAGLGDSWPRADDRSSADSDALGLLEGRLSRAVSQLEEAVAALSASGPAPLGSRPRGFRGRIDA